jgi:riboflavin synthase
MFSGIVESIGRVRKAEGGADGVRLSFEAREEMVEARLGDSIAVDGACLTLVGFDEEGFEVDLAPETLQRTTLGELQPGSRCNLERAMALGDRLGGHLVTGHIDGVGEVSGRRPEGDSHWITVTAPEEVMRYIVQKGSVAVDGISLTVAACGAETFSVAVIPYTAEQTTLLEKEVGSNVNLEADLVGKYVEKLLASFAEAKFSGSDAGAEERGTRGHA